MADNPERSDPNLPSDSKSNGRMRSSTLIHSARMVLENGDFATDAVRSILERIVDEAEANSVSLTSPTEGEIHVGSSANGRSISSCGGCEVDCTSPGTGVDRAYRAHRQARTRAKAAFAKGKAKRTTRRRR